jgi:hypothetical protein
LKAQAPGAFPRGGLIAFHFIHGVCHFLLRKWISWDGSLSLPPLSVRAGIVSDPASYRWSSYGEAIGGIAD